MRLKFTILLFVSMLCLATSLSGCGQKGDLYLPDPEEKKQKKPS